jgi:hypothetical protein
MDTTHAPQLFEYKGWTVRIVFAAVRGHVLRFSVYLSEAGREEWLLTLPIEFSDDVVMASLYSRDAACAHIDGLYMTP